MATNIVYKPGYKMRVAATNPAVPVSGSAVRYGQLTGMALTDEDAALLCSVDFGPFIARIPVFDRNTTGVNIGDPIFYEDDFGGLSNDAVNGYFYGMALAAVASNATTTIAVMHMPSPGAGAFANLGITTGKLANGAVTTIKIAALNITDALMSAPAALTLNSMRTAKFEWDSTIDAKAVGTVAFRGATLPAKARIVKGACYVKTALTGGVGSTAAIQVTGANDLITEAVVAGAPWHIADAMVPVIPVNTTATHIKCEAVGGKPSLVIGTNNLTAGHIDVWLDYVVVD